MAKITAISEGRALPLILKTVAREWVSLTDCSAGRQSTWRLCAPCSARLMGVPSQASSTSWRDFRAMRDGFPDLMLVRDDQISFLEVKAQGDAIRRNQLTRLRQLQAAGFDAGIMRADCRFDPQLVFSVVDIEKTGGWGAWWAETKPRRCSAPACRRSSEWKRAANCLSQSSLGTAWCEVKWGFCDEPERD